MENKNNIIDINDTERYLDFENWDYLDRKTNQVVNIYWKPTWKIIGTTKEQQEALNNFWAVINDEKTYKEAFPDKE